MNRLLVVSMLVASVVWADIPPADTGGCGGKAVGDACKRDDGSAGGCVKGTCSRNDYSNGPPPTQVAYECLRCDAAAVPAAPKKQSCTAVPGEGVVALLGLLFLRARRCRRSSGRIYFPR